MTTEILIFSDHHAHDFPYGATQELWEDGNHYNSRLLDSVRVLRQIRDYLVENPRIETCFFLGDLFHKRGVLKTEVFNLTFKAIQDICKVTTLYMIPGNHDFGKRDGSLHALEPFSAIDNCFIVDRAMTLPISDMSVSFIPYSDDLADIKNGFEVCAQEINGPGLNILLGHCGIRGAKVGADYVLENDSDISVSDIPTSAYDACFFGHFHEPQNLSPKVHYMGATMQHNWGDRGSSRGFNHITFDEDKTFTIKQIEAMAPEFLLIKPEEIKYLGGKDFVRVLVEDTSESALETIRESVNLMCDPIKLELIPQETKVELDNSAILPEDSLDLHKLVKHWAKNTPYLEPIGLELLTKAAGE